MEKIQNIFFYSVREDLVHAGVYSSSPVQFLSFWKFCRIFSWLINIFLR